VELQSVKRVGGAPQRGEGWWGARAIRGLVGLQSEERVGDIIPSVTGIGYSEKNRVSKDVCWGVCHATGDCTGNVLLFCFFI